MAEGLHNGSLPLQTTVRCSRKFHRSFIAEGYPSRLLERVFVSTGVHLVTEDKERQLRFQARLFDAVGQSVIATDLEGKVIYWNRVAEELYGWFAGKALVGRDAAQAQGRLPRAPVWHRNAHLRRSREPRRHERRLRRHIRAKGP